MTKPKLLAHLQNKRNQNGNRHKTKKQILNKIQKQKAGDNIINLSNTHVSDATKSILNKGLKFVSQPKPVGYQVITLHTEHANFNYDISTMDLHIKAQNNTHIIRMLLLYNILRHGLLSRPVENKRNPLGK
jgi:hypothetical protein